MRIIDGLRSLRGTPAEIPDCDRNELPQFFVEMGFKVGAEIGVYKGAFTEKFCQAGLKMFAIDGWLAYEDYNEPQRNFQARQDFLYGHTQRTLAPYPDCSIIRSKSMDALKYFEDGSLDFVYIDAHHGFKYAVEDAYEWSRKVRPGGIVSGHDYGNNRIIKVKLALDAYTQAYGIDNWYVLGRKRIIPGEKRERWRSWFWVNGGLDNHYNLSDMNTVDQSQYDGGGS